MTLSTPSYHQLETFQTRNQKLTEIRNLGVEPYPHNFKPTDKSGLLHTQYDGEEVGNSEAGASGSTPEAKLGGRLVLLRAMGKNIFAQVQDNDGQMQLMFNRDLSRVSGYEPEDGDPTHLKFIEKKLDLGDIIGVEGHLFRTQKGELTLFVKRLTLLCKTLLPLADKHAGLADKETRYRKRWLDLISNPEVRETFYIRSKILDVIRSQMAKDQFIEVETPVLQTLYGGAQARPFTTTLNALDQQMYLRISLEISLKKLIVGGMERVFEIGRVFRNENIDRNHNPEFTLLEAYAAYWDYHDMMHFVEKLFEAVAIELFGSTVVPFEDNGKRVEIEMKAPWRRLTMKEALQQFANLDVQQLSDDELREVLEKRGHTPEEETRRLSRGMMIANLFEELVEDQLIQPIHITDHPIETTPLCKPHRAHEHKTMGLVERFESYILGQEICNAYTELNDPVIQRQLLEDQQEQLAGGDDEANPLDEEFLEAICQGMAPAGGVGIGIDRMIMLFTSSHSIRDVLFFPWMKPEEGL